MDVTVLIPTRDRTAKLAACLQGLARQSHDSALYEVLIGFDGPDAAGVRGAHEAWREAGGPPDQLRTVECPPLGYNAARNALLPLARGRVMLSIDDDVRPETDLIAVHAREQSVAMGRGRPVITTGYSPFTARPDDTLFDLVLRETSLVFFYDRMVADGNPGRDWGFRHCWGLNFSAPLDMVRAVGGFTAIPGGYGYDDLELAWRLRGRFGTPVLFRPAARAEHDHRYTPREILVRERRLGNAAWHFARINAPFCREVFRRDIRSEAELEKSRELVERGAEHAAELERSFLRLGETAGADAAPGGVHAAYEEHLPLRRWHWHAGLLKAAQVVTIARVTTLSTRLTSTS